MQYQIECVPVQASDRVGGYAPRAANVAQRPLRLMGASGRPLNFTASQPRKRIAMSCAANKTLVLGYYQRVVAGGTLALIPNYIADSYIDHNAPPGSVRGPALAEMHLRAIRGTFPDFTLSTHEVIAENESVAVRVTAEGTHLGEWLGIKPTGKRIQLRGLNFDRVNNGRIVEH